MRTQLFKLFAGIAGVYHILLGLAGLLLPMETLGGVIGFMLGVQVVPDPQLFFTAKFSAAYILAFGVMLILLTANPVKNRALVIPVLILFGVRLVNKVLFFGPIAEALEVSTGRNLFGIAVILIFFLGILLTLPQRESTPNT